MRLLSSFRMARLSVVLTLFAALAGRAPSAGAAIIHVKATGTDNNNGETWETAKQTVAAGLTAAVADDQVWVAAGTYVERVVLKSGVALYGGFAGNETQLEQRNWVANVTVLDGNKAGSVVTSPSGLTPSARIDGFTIRNGSATTGGGVLCTSSSPTICNCLIVNNSAGSSGGGIYCATSSAAISNSIITANISNGAGGGVACMGGGTPTIANNRIVGNTAGSASMSSGGGVFCMSAAVIANNTIAGNIAKQGGGIRLSSSVTIANNIVAFNSSGIYGAGGTPVLRCNCVYNPGGADYTGLSAGIGDITVDPQFVAVEYGEVHLKLGSPCMDVGDNAAVQPGWVDMDGQERAQNGRVDIGADEFDGATPAFAPRVVRVKSSGNDAHDGSSWELAKLTVQAGIDAVSDAGGGEVWVAAGTYSQRITLKAGAHVCGGFAGTESDRDQRDRLVNVTILDGAAGGSVVTAVSGQRVSRIDGFTIRNGSGTVSGSARYGGGVYCSFGAPIISNNLITGNTVTGTNPCGGGVYCVYTGSALIEGNTVSGNTASAATAYGGGIYCGADAAPVISGNTIAGNTVSGTVTSGGNYGGGVACSGSSPVITNNSIKGNVISGRTAYGAGIHLMNASAVVCENEIAGNAWTSSVGGGSAFGGGICAQAASVQITANRITGNQVARFSSGCGGGVYCSGPSTAIIGNVINGNVASRYGAGVCCEATTMTASSNIVNGNVVAGYSGRGGAFFCTGPSSTMVNNTMLWNCAAQGAGLYCSSASAPIANNIIAFNTSGIHVGGGTPVLRNNCVYNPKGDDYAGCEPGAGDISVDPQVRDALFGEAHLAAGSSCIDAGDDSAVQTGWGDVDGEPRIQGMHVDIGADEFNGTTPVFAPTVIRVSPSGDDANDGSSWTLAKATIQAGIDAAADTGSGEVWVVAGTYPERVTLKAWVYVYGGFTGAEAGRDERDWEAHPTILDGAAGGTVVSALPGSAWCGVDGFTIRNGDTTSTQNVGGGVHCYLSCPRISHNIITGNAAYWAAGIYCESAWPTIADNRIEANAGDGIGCYSGAAPVILRNTIAGNTVWPAVAYGIFCDDQCAPIIQGNAILNNGYCGIRCDGECSPVITKNKVSGHYGGEVGGIDCMTVTSALIADNVVTGNGGTEAGGIRCTGSSVSASPIVLANNTVVRNSSRYAGAVQCAGEPVTVVNNIVAFNSAGVSVAAGHAADVRNNCVFNPDGYNYSGTLPGSGDISVDPRLVAADHGQVRLRSDSPCIDAGDDAAQPDATDIDGQPRPQGIHVDIGAHEHNGTQPPYVIPIFRVSLSGEDTNDGLTWMTAKRTVQAGIDAAANVGGGEVWVAEGIYLERTTLKAWTQVYGGFAGSENDRDKRDWLDHVTILDGNAGGSVVTANHGSGVCGVDGFTIRNGTGTGSATQRFGGGVCCSLAWLRIANSVITGNTVQPPGGGFGGGVYGTSCALTLINNAIVRNVAGGSGGGVSCSTECALDATDNVIAGNTALSGGGLYSTYLTNLAVTNSLVVGNSASAQGGGLHLDSSAQCVNCTVVGNTAGSSGAGVFAQSTADSLVNCIIYGNAGTSVGYSGTLKPTITYCDIQGGFTGQGNIDGSPLFIRDPDPGPDATWGTADDDYGDLRLQAGSPCIDAGSNAAVPAGILTDLDGHGRFYNDPATADCATCGLAPVVDMGAYEFIAGDYDRDGDLDFDDALVFGNCVSGSKVVYAADCLKADLDRDADVDQADFGIFQRCFSGPGQPVDPACAK